MSHCDDIAPASMTATKVHFHLEFHQSKPGNGGGKQVTRKNTKNKGNNTAVLNIIQMPKKMNPRVTGKK